MSEHLLGLAHRTKYSIALWATILSILVAAGPSLAANEARIRLDPPANALSGEATLQVEAGGELPLTLAPGLEVEDVTVDGRAVTPSRRGETTTVPLGAHGTHRVGIRWSGRLPPGGPPNRAQGAQVAPEGSYLPGGGGWLPEPEGTAGPWRVEIAVPPGQRALATGSLASEEEGPDGARAVFDAAPTEPPSVFAGPWTVRERVRDGVRYRTYFQAEVAELAEGYLDAAEDLVRRFSAEIGPYPYDGFAVASAPLPVGLAFPGLTYIHSRILPLPFLKAQSLPHEVLHSWWGNGVTVGRGGNWAEGLTTYMADHGLAEPDRRRSMRLDWLRDYAALPAERDLPLRAFAGRTHDADQVTGYGKTALVFHMLRSRVGEDAWDGGIRRFYAENLGKPATWDGLRRAFEAASGQDLAGFFAQWLERPGGPRLLPPEVRREGNALSLRLRQASPTYDLLVLVAIETEAGTERHVVPLPGAEVTARIETKAPPVSLTVDPDHDLFRHLDRAEAPAIFRDVTLGSGTVAVIAAEGPAADTARTLAARLLGSPPRVVPTLAAAGTAPVLVVGTTDRVERLMQAPGSLKGRGTARVWAESPEAAGPRMAIAAEDTAALEALLRPLPHYGRQSWLVFEGPRAIDRGVWEPRGSPMRITLP